ncbi:DNA topoisomerase I [Kaistia sp. 32K]|uniref:DNA topoisomerase IB n=1 Tax=Kaistia sp. 32K TaxID=2795690 RepID=UPI0019166994|nr:DNA topoisomerase IB [Kaistia sp. 32K]BCP53857.1 DNA topoisomerase I [Kaistia sp. 32K]
MSDTKDEPDSEAEIAAELDMEGVEGLTIRRRRRGKGFLYFDARGKRIRSKSDLERIAHLAIPPAYDSVRIAANPASHLQAIGRDAAGRWQHRYHEAWTIVREARKVGRLDGLIAVLPKLRATVRRDLARRELDRRKALACAVAILDETHIRVGSEPYLSTSGARGAATLLKRQSVLGRSRVLLCFRGKGGTRFRCTVVHSSLARALGRITTLPGRRLLQYLDADGAVRPIRAPDINAYLREVSGAPITAKDLRMLAANAIAAEHFARLEPEASETARRRQVAAVMRQVSEHLGNTPAVTRKSYVHAKVVEAFAAGKLPKLLRSSRSANQRKRGETLLRRLLLL